MKKIYKVYDKSKFTKNEYEVLELLALAWNKFIALPNQHPQDTDEFMRAIHEAQRIVGVRPIRVEDV